MSSVLPVMRHVARLRFPLICFAAVSVSLPIAWISLAKLFLFGACLVALLAQWANQQRDTALAQLNTAHVVLASLALFAISLAWSSAPQEVALLALTKHGKLIEILMLISLIRTEREARTAIGAFLAGQAFLLASSWAMVAGIPIPWATSAWATVPNLKYVVYSTYLDQSIIFATSAAVFWHLRTLWPRSHWLAAIFAVLALINTLLLLDGRTGYLVAMTMITLAVMWAMPKKIRLITAVLAPAIILTAVVLTSSKVSQRLSTMVSEGQGYASQGVRESSSGFRLNAWRRSLQAMAQEPLLGHGVGSWTDSVKRIEGASAQKIFGEGNSSNPHQEYLLWGVELGVCGALLLLAMFVGIWRDANRFSVPVMRATISVAAAAAVACLFNSSLYDALMGDFFCVALGLLMAMGVRAQSTAAMPIQDALATEATP
jgi:O-antigen ligase